MTGAHCLVVAKAPVPGVAKTRLGADVGPRAAADVAAAALLDTLDTCGEAFPPGRRHVALAGRLEDAARGREISRLLAGWSVFDQVGRGFPARLAAAHAEVGRRTGAATVQVGMDTPQLTADLLHAVAAGLDDHDAVLGPADDGGWWVLALRDPADAAVLAGVPTSTPDTGARTREALRARGLSVGEAPGLRDVDTATDAHAVAGCAPHGRFAAAWSAWRARSVG
jgi:glycosyltransferase A (GT-A) superfamily protein (DUF2064 family)